MSTDVISLGSGAPAAVTAPTGTTQVAYTGPDPALVVPFPGPAGPAGDASALSQIQVTGIAAQALSGHRVVTERWDGRIDYASNDSLSYSSAPLWVTTGAASSGAEVTALAFGRLTEPTWAWAPGSPVFLGQNGALTQTVPSNPPALFVAQVGTALDATTIFVDRFPSINLG